MSERDSDTKIQFIGRQDKKDLMEFCSACIALILQLRNTSEYGEQDTLRSRIHELLKKVERDAKVAGIDYEDIHYAIFALVAFIDETIIASGWSQKEAWLAKPLQLELFNRFDAGEEFFIRLEKLRQRAQYNKSVLELYYLCMTLGFKGKYQLQEREELRQIIEETYADLRHVKGRSAEILSPHGKRKDEIVEVVKKEVPAWVVIVSAFAIGFFFYLIMTFLISDSAGDVKQIIEKVL